MRDGDRANKNEIIVLVFSATSYDFPHSDALERRPQLAGAIKAARKLKGDVNFVSGLMTHKVPFITIELGADTDPFLLHLFAALAERERRMIGERTTLALQAAKARGVKLGGSNFQSELNRDEAQQRARVIHNADAGLLDRYVQSSKMVHAALLLLMLEAAKARPRFTISLKRSTQNLQLSTSWPADYPIYCVPVWVIDKRPLWDGNCRYPRAR